MKVYVLKTRAYEQRVVHGVYSTPELAMAAWTPKPGAVRGPEYGSLAGQPWSYEWERVNEGQWIFRADWEDVADITEYDLDGDSE